MRGLDGRTLKRRETTVHDQLEIAQLALSKDDSREGLGLGGELLLAGSIAGEQVLEDTTVGSVGHGVKMRRKRGWGGNGGKEEGEMGKGGM